MDEQHNRGILFRGGPGTLVRNVAGQTIYESVLSGGAASVAAKLPLTISIANENGPRIRVKYGLVGGWVADATMDPFEDGSEVHPFFYLQSGLLDQDYIFVNLTVSYDGFFWRVDAATIQRDIAEPTPSATNAYAMLGRIEIENDAVTAVSQTQFGNVAWIRGGDADNFQDVFYYQF